MQPTITVIHFKTYNAGIYISYKLVSINVEFSLFLQEAEVTESGLMKTVRFAPSPVMSTYLLAWVIGEFDYLEGEWVRS